jgi:hypothetical protein
MLSLFSKLLALSCGSFMPTVTNTCAALFISFNNLEESSVN